MAGQTILPQGMDPDRLQKWLKDNPTGTEKDAIRDYINHRARKEGRNPREILLEEYPQLDSRGGLAFGAQAPNPQNRLDQPPLEQSNAPQGHPWRTVDPGQGGTGGDVVRGLLDTMMATNPVTGAGRGIASRVGEMAVRGATADTAAGALTGDDPSVLTPLFGAAKGAFSQGVGEGVGYGSALVQNMGKIAREHLATTSNRLKWAARDAKDAFEGVIREIPVFLRVLPGSKSYADALLKLTQAVAGGSKNKSLGEKYLSEATQQAEDLVARNLGGRQADVVVPTVRRSLADAKFREQADTLMAGKSGSLNLDPYATPMTVQQALDGLKMMTAQAIAAKKSLESHGLWEAVKKGTDEFLARVQPDLAKKFRNELNQYGKGLALLRSLEDGFNNKLTSPKRTVFDADAFLDGLRERGFAEFFPNLNQALLRGAESGAREYIRSMPRGRIYRLGESATFSIPGLRTAARGGSPDFMQGAGPNPHATGLTLTSIGEMTRASDSPGSYVIEP